MEMNHKICEMLLMHKYTDVPLGLRVRNCTADNVHASAKTHQFTQERGVLRFARIWAVQALHCSGHGEAGAESTGGEAARNGCQTCSHLVTSTSIA